MVIANCYKSITLKQKVVKGEILAFLDCQVGARLRLSFSTQGSKDRAWL
jgi:hypothetical protein